MIGLLKSLCYRNTYNAETDEFSTTGYRVDKRLHDEFQKYLEFLHDRLDAPYDRILSYARFVDDFGIDSLDLVSLVIDAEEEFDIDFPLKGSEIPRTVAGGWEAVQKELLKKKRYRSK